MKEGQYVVVRTYSAGVHVGEFVTRNGRSGSGSGRGCGSGDGNGYDARQ